MKTFIKALLISASIAGLTNMAAIAADIKTGPQDEAPCHGVADETKKPLEADATQAPAKKKKQAVVDVATGGAAEASKKVSK